MENANIQEHWDPTAPSSISVISTTPSKQPGPQTVGESGASAKKTNKSDQSSAGCCGTLAGLIVGGFGAAAVYVYVNIYLASTDLHSDYNPYDQIVASRVADDYSTVLCDTFTVSTFVQSGANFYLTNGPAKVTPDSRSVVTVNGLLGPYERYSDWAFYLMPGSHIETRACLNPSSENTSVHAELLFIKSASNFDQWKDDSSCADCVVRRDIIGPDKLCDDKKDAFARFEVNHHDDNYYVVIARPSDVSSGFMADVKLTVNKTVYNVSDARDTCLFSKACTFQLPYNSEDEVIVQFLNTDRVENTFTAECGKRVSFALIVFFAVPMGLLILISVVGCWCCNCCGSSTVKKRRSDKFLIRSGTI